MAEVVDVSAGVDPGALDAAVERAAAVLADGGVVVVPTDTVYGVAARADRPAGIDRLFALKGRNRTNPVAVLVADLAQAAEVVEVDGPLTALAAACWPGALTVVARRRVGFTADLGGDGATIGVRAPRLALLGDLLARTGPLATTSANLSGRPPCPDVESVLTELVGEHVDLVLDAGRLDGSPSTVVAVTGGEPTVLREGTVTVAEVRAALRRLS